MSSRGHVPIRTCIGCHKRRKKGEMIGLTLNPEGGVQVHLKFPRRGRGAYLCPNLGCFNKAKKKFKEIRFLEANEFQALFAKNPSNQIERWDRGGSE